MRRLAGYGVRFGSELHDLWLEYESQQTPESPCVQAGWLIDG
jgi:hypothetical protein